MVDGKPRKKTEKMVSSSGTTGDFAQFSSLALVHFSFRPNPKSVSVILSKKYSLCHKKIAWNKKTEKKAIRTVVVRTVVALSCPPAKSEKVLRS